MKISEKDRSQVLRMAGNIAGGMITMVQPFSKVYLDIPRRSVQVAIEILAEVDRVNSEPTDDGRD